MSFCRITGKSRGLPKPNYFPLLPPISPADAKRFCRITNKSHGLPGHHFIPALLSARGLRAHCRVTGKSEGQAPHHFPNVDATLKTHDIIPGYKYVFPKFDEDKKLHGRILNLIYSKTQAGESNAKYVYTVEERLTGLVIPAGLEAAVRDGDIRDLMLDKEKDTMLVKLHQGPSVTIDVTDLVIGEGEVLWEGMGPSQSVLKQWEKEEKDMEMQKKKRKEGLHKRKQIFEDKERAADEEESEMERIKDARKSKIVKVKMRGGSEDVDVVMEHGPTPIHNPLKEINGEPVFGHIVQTGTAVEFFPGDSILNLPEGKVVPGQLVRNAEGIKFVPGIMSDGRFVPGQVVMTNSGEQFVPGQVVDTRDGPKFVPGHVVETVSGPKFVPGQTIETVDGPQFVPGQIIETKAGPTFIPGQIIVTDDEPRFVPGRVVETAEGPRFVPGRVIESGNQVTFISGQVVETSEGLKFVAPDLEYIPEGGHEFSVQGFEVSPEELKLLRPSATCEAATCGVFTVDSKMLRQLSEAGMTVGRQVPAKLPEVDISELPLVVEKLNLNGAQALKMSHVMTVLSQVALKISQRSDLCASDVPLDEDAGDKLLLAVKKDKDLGKYLQAIVASSVVAARNNFDEESFVTAVSSALESALASQLDSNITKESILSVIGEVIESQFPNEKAVMKENLLADIKTRMESEMEAQLEHRVTKESMMKILNTVLEGKLGKDDTIASTKAALIEAVKSAIDKEQTVMYKENMSKEKFLAVISSVMDSGVLEEASSSLSKESLLKEISSELKNGETPESEWVFAEESVLPIIKSAIEKEVAAKGLTLNNGSLPSAIMASIKKELCALPEEKILQCVNYVIENDLPEEISNIISEKDLLKAVNSAVAMEKSLARQKALSEDALLATAYAALDKSVSAKLKEIPNGKVLLEKTIAKIKEEVAVKHENAEMKKAMLGNIEKAVEKKITETCSDLLTEEMAIAAVNAVIENEFQQKTLPKEKVPMLIKSVFEKQKSANNSSVMTKEKLIATLHDVMMEDGLLKNGTVKPVMNAVAEKKILKACDNILNEEMALAVISYVMEDGILLKMGESLPKAIEKLSKVIQSTYEKEKLTNNTSVMTKEKLLETLQVALQENGLFCNKTVKKAFSAAVESKIMETYDATLNEELALAVINSVLEAEILQKAGMSLPKEKIPLLIKSAFEKGKVNGQKSVISKEKLLTALHVVMDEESVFRNEEVKVAFNSALRTAISDTSGTIFNEEMALNAINSVIEIEIQENLGVSLTEEKAKMGLIIKSVFDSQKATNCTSVMTKEKLLAILQDVVEHEKVFNSEQIKSAFKQCIEKKISGTSGVILDEEIAVAAVTSVIANEFESKRGVTLPKSKIPQIIKSVFEKEKLANNNSIMNKEKLLSALNEAIEEEGVFSGTSVMTAFNAAVEEKRKTKYQNPLTEDIITSAIDSAINAIIAQEEDVKVSKASLVSAVMSEMKKIKSCNPEGVTEGRILAAVRSAITEEVTSKNEKISVEEKLLEAFDSVIEDTLKVKLPNLLTEAEVLSTLDSAIESGLSRIPQCTLTKSELISKIKSEITKKKLRKRESILTEKVLLECMQSAIEAEVAALCEQPSVAESLLSSVNSAIETEKRIKRYAALSEGAVIQAVSSAMDSKLIQNNKITLTKEELVTMVSKAIRERNGETLTEESLVKIVQSTIENKVADEGESHLILKAFGSAIEEARIVARKKPIPEKAFLQIVGSAIESELSVYGETSLSKDKLLSAITTTVDNEVTKHGSLLTEEGIVAAAYSAIQTEACEKGESFLVNELLSGIDLIVEKERNAKRVVNEEIILEAINSIADEYTEDPEKKAAVILEVMSAVKKAKEENGEVNGKLLDAVSVVVREQLAEKDGEFSKDVFMTAVTSEIAKQQETKRETFMTKEILSAVVSSAVEDQLSKNPGIMHLKETLLKAADAAVEMECTSICDKRLTEKALLAAIGSSIERVLGEFSDTSSLEKVVNSMQKYLSENLDQVIVGTVNYMVANESPMDKLKYAVNNSGNTMQVIEKLSSVLNDNMGEAFQKLSAGDPSLLRNVIGMLKMEDLTSKDHATEALQKAIVGAVRQRSVETLRSLMENSKDTDKDFKELLMQSVGLAKALGMNQVATVLLDVVSDSKSHEVLANDETIMDVLQRLTIMRQFAETKPELASALSHLISDPELAKRDPGIRELVRHSTALMTVPEETLRSSADIPFSLLVSDNTLAMEQFLARARRPRTLVIVKSGIQAVVPKEAARAVLTGQVPYAVLDEKGIKYFEPLHVFSTMKLPYYAAHCFSMYRCPEMECETETPTPTLATPRGSFSSAEDCLNQRKSVIMNGHCPRRFDKHIPTARRVSELSKRQNYSFYSKTCPLVFRTRSASRISDFGKKPECTFLSDVYN